jgi:hypothetical protein
MDKKPILFTLVLVILWITSMTPASAENTAPAADTGLSREVADLKSKISSLEEKIGENDKKPLFQSALSGIGIAGGISGGSFYTSNPGPDVSDNEFLLSNFLVELSSKDESLPVGFIGAFGETSTPSVLDTPETNKNLDIEYAALVLKPIEGVNIEAGLLQPVAGLECTYTYDNQNIFLGAVASQQPYNAYGARLVYDIHEINFTAGYYKERLDDEEYGVNGLTPDDSWEIGVAGSVGETEFAVDHYHLTGMRNLTCLVVKHTMDMVEIGIDADYWRWDERLKDDFGREYAAGGAVYICPRFDKISVPVRLEYIDQGESTIYIENTDAKRIYTATISPTYNFSEKSYFRVESAYVNADSSFADKDGKSEDGRGCFSAEVGYLF